MSATGFVFLDKPAGMTSHDVVARARRILGTRRIGHAGTLDPSATGVLILGVGRATRLLAFASEADKAYRASIRLGQTTPTDDADSPVTDFADTSGLTDAVIAAAASHFVGVLDQRPSAVSAVKVAGRRAHARVRAGEQVELPSRKVRIDEFTITAVHRVDGCTDVDVSVRCGSGTYVRALARDLGAQLGVGGHVRTLRRTESSGVTVSRCVSLDSFEADPHLVAVSEAVGLWLPIGEVATPELLTNGIAVDAPHGLVGPTVAVADADGEIVSVCRHRHGMLEPSVVLVEPRPLARQGDSR